MVKWIGLLLAFLGAMNMAWGQRPDDRSVSKIEGLSDLRETDPDIYEHFQLLLDEMGSDVSVGDIEFNSTSAGDEIFVAIETEDDLRIFWVVRQDNGSYETAAEVSVLLESMTGDATETQLLASNPSLAERSVQMFILHRDIEENVDLDVMADNQAMTRSSSPSPVTVSCAQSGGAVCCGFSRGSSVRIICVCNVGSNRWETCFDSKWV